jgi:hypothetical protein
MATPTIETLLKELSELRARIDAMEGARAEDATKQLELLAGDHAMREGLLQFTQEIAARDGLPVEHFVNRFHAAIDWHRDRFLRMVEGVDPRLAAQIDQRDLADIPTEEQPPCILPG